MNRDVTGKGRVGNNLVLGETKLSNSWKGETKLSNIMVGNCCHCFLLSFNYLSVKCVSVCVLLIYITTSSLLRIILQK